MCSYTL